MAHVGSLRSLASPNHHRRGRTIHADLAWLRFIPMHFSYRARCMPCATQGGTGLARQREGWISPSLCLLSYCVMLVGSNGDVWRLDVVVGGVVWVLRLPVHGLRMVGWPCGPLSVDRALVGLWWLLGVLALGCCCLCALRRLMASEKYLQKPVALWISTSAY